MPGMTRPRPGSGKYPGKFMRERRVGLLLYMAMRPRQDHSEVLGDYKEIFLMNT